MGKLDGGITGVMTGKIAGIVGSKARGRRGTINTVRQYVRPANPNTPDQQTQRSKFSDVLRTVRDMGPGIYQTDWNRSVNQLPGFQSLMSILLNDISDVLDYTAPPDTPLGDLHFPDTFALTAPSTNNIGVSYSAENGANGTAADKAGMIAIRVSPDPITGKHTVFVVNFADTRADGNFSVNTGEAVEAYLVVFYLRGEGTADGLLTLARWLIGNTGA